MADRTRYPENDPRHHTNAMRSMLASVVQQAREDVRKIDDPKAQALLETTAEVCVGLATAFEHYEEQSEPAWQR